MTDIELEQFSALIQQLIDQSEERIKNYDQRIKQLSFEIMQLERNLYGK